MVSAAVGGARVRWARVAVALLLLPGFAAAQDLMRWSSAVRRIA